MKRTAHPNQLRSQEGSLLVIALVILGAIALSTIYLSLVLLSEIRSTRFVDNGIVAHYVAESGSERLLWRVKLAKQLENPAYFTAFAGSAPNLCAAEDDGVGACEDPERTNTVTKAAASATDFTAYDVPRNVPVLTDIFDPLQESGPINTGITQVTADWYVTTCSGSAKLETTYIPIQYSGGSLQTQNPVTQVNVCGCGVQTALGYTCTPNVTIAGLSLNKFYRFSFRSLDTPIKKITMTASVAIPSQVETKITGAYRESRIGVTARSMWKDVISGLFNYVVFSEESLIKDTKSALGAPYGSLCGFCSDSTSVNQVTCSSNSDCTGGNTCSIINNAADAIDVAGTRSFCSNTTGGESYTSPISQTSSGSCNQSCNGYTFCGDGVWQSPNGAGDGYNSGAEECDSGVANSNIVPLSCRKDCRDPYCGDLVVDNGTYIDRQGSSVPKTEDCDENNASNADTCYAPGHANQCKFTICGDGIKQTPNGVGFPEACDGSQLGSCTTCTGSCTCGS